MGVVPLICPKVIVPPVVGVPTGGTVPNSPAVDVLDEPVELVDLVVLVVLLVPEDEGLELLLPQAARTIAALAATATQER